MNNWSEYEKLVLFRLDQIEGRIKDLTDGQIKHQDQLTKLNLRSSIWGAVGGVGSSLVSGFVSALFGMFNKPRY